MQYRLRAHIILFCLALELVLFIFCHICPPAHRFTALTVQQYHTCTMCITCTAQTIINITAQTISYCVSTLITLFSSTLELILFTFYRILRAQLPVSVCLLCRLPALIYKRNIRNCRCVKFEETDANFIILSFLYFRP